MMYTQRLMQAMEAVEGQVPPLRRGGTAGLGTPDRRLPARDVYVMSGEMAEEHHREEPESNGLGGLMDAMLRWVKPDGSQNEDRGTHATLRIRAYVEGVSLVRRIHVFEIEDTARGTFSEYSRDVNTVELHWAQALVGRTYRVMVTYSDGEVVVREERMPTSEGLYIEIARAEAVALT